MFDKDVGCNREVFKVFFRNLVLIVFILSGIILYIYQSIQVSNLRYNINKVQILKEDLQQEQSKLSLEIATLCTPDRIKKIAKAKLKLVPIKEDNVILISY